MRQRVRADFAKLTGGKIVFAHRFGDFGGKSFSLVTRSDSISNLGHAFGIWRTLETAHPDQSAIGLVYDMKTDLPIVRTGIQHLIDPFLRNLFPVIAKALRNVSSKISFVGLGAFKERAQPGWRVPFDQQMRRFNGHA
jgi:hypothetical protein